MAFLIGNLPWLFIAHALVLRPEWHPPRTKLAGAWVLWQVAAVIALVGVALQVLLVRARRRTGHAAPGPADRRAFLRRAAASTGALLVGVGGYGLWNASRHPPVTRLTLFLPGLPPPFDGFTIAHVSDVHAGFALSDDDLHALAFLIRALSADLVVMTGDLVDGGSPDPGSYARAFRDLNARHGILAVLGNHDHYAGAARVVRAARDAGQTVLQNSFQVIERGDAALVVLGLDDPQRRGFDPPQGLALEALLRRAPAFTPRILLAHRPGVFSTASQSGVLLTLAGHTHGGQIGLPLLDLTPARLITRFPSGHYRLDRAQLYVSRGIGCTGVPLRIGIPPELPLLTLRRAPPEPAASA